MREIKFRIWDKENKKMICKFSFGEHDVNESFKFLNKTDSVMQFTGLKDKNGKEIYEGDILKGNTDIAGVEVGIVEYYSFEDAFFGVNIGFSVISFHDYMWGHNIEVIGNIYENKELLKN